MLSCGFEPVRNTEMDENNRDNERSIRILCCRAVLSLSEAPKWMKTAEKTEKTLEFYVMEQGGRWRRRKDG